MFFRFVSKFGLALAPLGVLSGVVSNFLGPLSGESESDSSQLDVSDICLSDLGNDTKREETNRANRAPPIALSQKAPKQISHLPIVNGAMYNSRNFSWVPSFYFRRFIVTLFDIGEFGVRTRTLLM